MPLYRGGSFLEPPYTGRIMIARLKGANMNVTTDQAFEFLQKPALYAIDGFLVTNASISLTTAAGGVYTAISKGGTALVAASQVFSGLTGQLPNVAASLIGMTVVGLANTAYNWQALWLSLTTAQGAAATADFYLWGRPIF